MICTIGTVPIAILLEHLSKNIFRDKVYVLTRLIDLILTFFGEDHNPRFSCESDEKPDSQPGLRIRILLRIRTFFDGSGS